MQKPQEEKKEQNESYHCPNPSCNKVFLRPKIIKYYVCPACQTLVKMDTAEGKPKKKGVTKAELERKETERLEAERKAEHAEVKRKEAEKKAEQLQAEIEAERKKVIIRSMKDEKKS